MHEVSIMEEAVRMAVDAANEAGALRVLKLRLAIGTLSCVAPEALQFAFEAVSSDTPAADASLEIEPVPAVKWCETCKIEFPVANFFDPCPGCHDIKGPLRRGREIYIASIEVE